MKRIMIIIFFLVMPTTALASVLEGTYSGTADTGIWMMFLNDSSSDGTLYMFSDRYSFVRYGNGTYNSVTGEIEVPSMTSPLSDTSSMSATLSGTTVSGTWNSSTFGRGTLTGDNRSPDFYTSFIGYRNIQVNDNSGVFMALVQFAAQGKATLYDRYGAQIGSGFISSNGTFAVAVTGTKVTLKGIISGGSFTNGYWADYATGASAWPSVDEISCRVFPNYIHLNKTSFPRVGERVLFNTDSISDCPNTATYYKFFYCPDYGSASYDQNLWVNMNSFTVDSSLEYAFPDPGYYVVVVWTSSKPDQPAPITQGGFTVLVTN